MDQGSRTQCRDVYSKIRTSKIDEDLYASQALQINEKDGKFQVSHTKEKPCGFALLGNIFSSLNCCNLTNLVCYYNWKGCDNISQVLEISIGNALF